MKTIEKIINYYVLFKFKNRSGVKIIDIGCGSGKTVLKLIDLYGDAYGVDIKFKVDDYGTQQTLIFKDKLRLIGLDGVMPFEDGFADLTFSHAVIEHVENLDSFFRELARISSRESISVHYFPSSYKLIEPHVNIPFATKIKTLNYIKFWLRINKFGCPRRDWAERGAEEIFNYLEKFTHYRSSKEIESVALRYFEDVSWDLSLLKFIDKKLQN